MSKVYGFGVNDATYKVHHCPFYARWCAILRRSYCEKWKAAHPTYNGCFVHEDWLLFSNFKSWMDAQDWEGKHLDKDLLVLGNKMYSRSTCLFIDQEVNKFFNCGVYPFGVNFDKNLQKFKARVNINGKNKHLGMFETESSAYKAWETEKTKACIELAGRQTDQKVADAILKRCGNWQ